MLATILFYYFQKTMIKKHESTLASSTQIRKKRPSIEFSPTLEKPVFIITKNLNGRHIIHLTQQLDKHKIPYQMQQQTQTLGFKLNQRFFVIVDNKSGEVTLGAEFGSILMAVVGYPKIGKNKKNKYFEKPSQIIDFYELFKNNKDISQREKSLINKQYCDIILEKDSASKLRSKIVVRSISKYKSPEKESYLKSSDIKEKKGDKKLIIIQDKTSDVQSKLCELLSSLIPKESLLKIQKVEQVRQLTLFTTNKAQVYYLVNQSNEKELLDTIFIGEAIVFNSQIALRNLKSVFTDPKIYGITSKQKQIMKMLLTIGLIKKQQSQIVVSKLPSVSLINSQIPKINIRQNKVSQKSQKMDQSRKQQNMVTELSRIEGLNSMISEEVKQKDMNVSISSQSPSNSRVKVKKINKSRKKDAIPQVNISSQYYAFDKKQNQIPPLQKSELRTSRKKNLRTEEKQSLEKPKKNLKFVDSPKEQVKIKRVRSISRVQPKTIEIATQSNATMTQNEYFQSYTKPAKSSTIQPKTRKISHFQNKPSSALKSYLKNSINIDALFYRQFVQEYKLLAETIKQNPSSLLPQAEKAIVQPFFNMTQFDRYARKIKRKLKDGGHASQQFNFMAFVLEQQLAGFEKYCFEKNKSYKQQGYEIENSLKASNFSSTYSSIKNPNITIYVFIECATQVKQKTLNFGKIKILEFGFPRVEQDQNVEKTLYYIRDKLVQNNLVDNREYFRS